MRRVSYLSHQFTHLRPMRKNLFLLIFMGLISHLVTAQELGLKVNKEFGNLESWVVQAQFSPFRNYFAYAIGDNTLRVYDRDWEKILEHQGNPEAFGGVFAFSPDEKYLVYGRYQGNSDIAIIRLEDMNVTQVLNQHSFSISHLEFSNDGKWMVSSSLDEQVMIWKLKDESFEFVKLYDEFESDVNETSFSFDDRYLATGDTYGNVLVLRNKESGFELFQKFKYRRHGVQTIAFHPQEYSFVTGSSNGLRRYKLQGDAFVLTDSLEERTDVRNPVHYSPDGNFLAYGHYRTAVISRLVNDSIYPVDFVYRHMDNVFGASFSEDGEFLTTYGGDKQIIIWEINKVSPSDKSLVVSWLNADLSLAQRRSLNPSAVKEIVESVNKKLTLPRDEFETSQEYADRMKKLAQWTLMKMQKEMENLYDVQTRAGTVEIPLQGLIGYNADLQIYKIKFMETEAGVAIPIEAARKFKSQWTKARITAVKEKGDSGKSSRYTSFKLYNPADRKYYKVTPLENPFQMEEEQASERAVVKSIELPDSLKYVGSSTTYALMFATNVYDYYSDLINPVLDAQTIAAELEESYGVISEVVLNPTLSETASVIRKFATQRYKPEDNLMIFFAGHGVYDEVFREGYVISRDSRADDMGKTSYLSHSNLRTMINNIGCSHIFLVMDVCFGGTFDPLLSSSHRGVSAEYAEISTQEFVERKLKYKTRLYLTSGGKEYVPDGRPGFHSPFARRLIESLRYYGGSDGVLTTSEILQFVEKVNPQPRFGEFGDNEPGSDFILVVR